MKNTPTQIIVFFLSIILLAGCSKDAPSQNPPATNSSFAKGADISWLPQMEATGYGMVFMLVGMLFSGFMYPVNNMPLPLQIFGSIFPVTYFIRISRSVFLKGVGLNFVWSDGLILAFYCVVIILIVSRVFKQRLD